MKLLVSPVAAKSLGVAGERQERTINLDLGVSHPVDKIVLLPT